MSAAGSEPDTPHIGTLNESTLHSQLKELVAEPGDRYEVPLDGFVIDVVRPGQLIEIQTGSFAAMGNKLDRLLAEHRIHLVHPVATETYLLRGDARPRRSPKRGSIYDVFGELVSVPTLLDHPHLSIEVVLASIDKVQIEDPTARRGRGGYRTVDRRLREVHDRRRFDRPDDLLQLVPEGLPDVFTTADIAKSAAIARSAAQQLAYCLRALELFIEVDRTRSGIRYAMASASDTRA